MSLAPWASSDTDSTLFNGASAADVRTRCRVIHSPLQTRGFDHRFIPAVRLLVNQPIADLVRYVVAYRGIAAIANKQSVEQSIDILLEMSKLFGSHVRTRCQP